MFRSLIIPAALLVVLPASAQSVDQILNQHIQAIGGKEAMDKVQSMRLSLKMTMGPGMEAPMTVEMKKPGKMRTELSMMGQSITVVVNGKQGYMINPMMGGNEPKPLPEEALKQSEAQANQFTSPLMGVKNQGGKIELVGKEKTDDGEAFKLKMTDKDGQESHAWIDADSYLLTKMTVKNKQMGQEINATIKFGDYKAIKSLLFAHSVDVTAEGMPMNQKITMEKVEVDCPIEDARFEIPKMDAKPAAPAKPAEPAKAPEPAKPTKK